jgi:hypothetical protein
MSSSLCNDYGKSRVNQLNVILTAVLNDFRVTGYGNAYWAEIEFIN